MNSQLKPKSLNILDEHLKHMTTQSGVYHMMDKNKNILYVGKAQNLKKRLQSYGRVDKLCQRIALMVSLIDDIKIIVTKTNLEALLLEAEMIKKYRPKFNILLKDDTSFPYISLTKDHPFPRMDKYRGKKQKHHQYFGPFASIWAVDQTLKSLQYAFLLRSCSDHVFHNRSRPCLMYQVQRCSAPCVGKISSQDYNSQMKACEQFLNGQSQTVIKKLEEKMTQASDGLNYEKAAHYRDQIRALSQIQSHQNIHIPHEEDIDIIALSYQNKKSCIHVTFFRSGTFFGQRHYFPQHNSHTDSKDIISGFINLFYAKHQPPQRIITNVLIHDLPFMDHILKEKSSRFKHIHIPQKGILKKLLDMGYENAQKTLEEKLKKDIANQKFFHDLTNILNLPMPIKRIEIYDNSHIQGAHSIGAMVVADFQGWVKSDYRKFNFSSSKIKPGDDYAMMENMLRRRFSNYHKNPEKWSMPELCIIDGGANHLKVAQNVIKDLHVDVALMAISKSPGRRNGNETFHTQNTSFCLPQRDPLLYFLQTLRDEAHRWAIGAHRKKRSKNLKQSPLDDIEGIGAVRKKALLNRFGSWTDIQNAAPEDLEKCPGINKNLAEKIYLHFH